MIVWPGSTGFEKRTASRFSRVGIAAGELLRSRAQHVKAIVQSPWMMIPGRPTDFAISSSRWIGTLSPEASA